MLKNKKNIPLKNYIYLAIVIFVSLLLLFYFYLWHLTYEEGKLESPIMDKYLQVINYNELSDYIIENKDAFVYVSVLEDKEIRNFEKKFKSLVIDYSLKDKMLYLDLTTVNYDSNDILSNVNIINDDNLSLNIPCIMVFSDGKLSYVYNISSNNYDINSLSDFLEKEGLLDND